MRALHQYLNKVLRHPFLLRPVGGCCFFYYFVLFLDFFLFPLKSLQGEADMCCLCGSACNEPMCSTEREDEISALRPRDRMETKQTMSQQEPERSLFQRLRLIKSSSIGWKKKFTNAVNRNYKPR